MGRKGATEREGKEVGRGRGWEGERGRRQEEGGFHRCMMECLGGHRL